MVNVLSFDKDSLSGCGFATFARSGGGSVVGLIIILLILGALLLVVTTVFLVVYGISVWRSPGR